MKKLNDVPTNQLADVLGVLKTYASNMKAGRVKPSAKVAQQINEAFGVPLWEIRPDIYPRHLFEANDATEPNSVPRPVKEGVNV
jgi:DNA-binding transcriptional regulator YdaS (Cro superfamily)